MPERRDPLSRSDIEGGGEIPIGLGDDQRAKLVVAPAGSQPDDCGEQEHEHSQYPQREVPAPAAYRIVAVRPFRCQHVSSPRERKSAAPVRANGRNPEVSSGKPFHPARRARRINGREHDDRHLRDGRILHLRGGGTPSRPSPASSGRAGLRPGGRPASRYLERITAIRGRFGSESLEREQLRHHLAQVGVVFDDQNRAMRCGPGLNGRLCHRKGVHSGLSRSNDSAKVQARPHRPPMSSHADL